MMHEFVIDSSDKEGFVELCESELALGFRWACTSNAGLKDGKIRVTFVRESAFQ